MVAEAGRVAVGSDSGDEEVRPGVSSSAAAGGGGGDGWHSSSDLHASCVNCKEEIFCTMGSIKVKKACLS